MKTFFAVLCTLSVAHGAFVAIIPAAIPAVSHYHAQDGWGQYSYGYSGGPSAKQELRTADGITQGGYTYIDANNIIQTVSYVSDPVNGFRVAATNLPQQAPHIVAPLVAPVAPEPIAPVEDKKEEVQQMIPEYTPEVVAARAAHLKAHEEAKAAAEATGSDDESSEHSRKRRSAVLAAPLAYYSAPLAYHSAPLAYHSAPLAYHSAPLAYYSPIISTQYEVKDNLGQYTYGYNDGLSAKAETRSFDGITSGGYSYLDSNNVVQNVNYVADHNGFRVKASNLPEAPKVVEAPALVAPVAPEDTPEVIAARAAHLEAHEKAKSQ